MSVQAVDFIHKVVDPYYSMKNIVLLSIISAFIQGCTSIAQPTASRPLVEHEFATPTKSVDLSLSTALSNSKVGVALVLEQDPVVMGDKFFAAIGLTCRKLNSNKTGQHIYCLDNRGDWFKVKRVISEYNDSVLSEASL